MGPHFAAGVQQDAQEFLRSLTANMHLADLSVGGSPHPHTQQHTNMLDGIFGGLLRSQVRCGLCPCKTKTCATKRLALHSTPRVLQLHRKRFGIFEVGGSAKIGHHATFPELLNVQLFTSPEGQYSEISLDFALYAVVVHVGASIQRGHYVAYVKDPRGEWFQMDDHKASPVSLSEDVQVHAYMLFYIQTIHRIAGIDSVNQ